MQVPPAREPPVTRFGSRAADGGSCGARRRGPKTSGRAMGIGNGSRRFRAPYTRPHGAQDAHGAQFRRLRPGVAQVERGYPHEQVQPAQVDGTES
jgi:hypothetical protein